MFCIPPLSSIANPLLPMQAGWHPDFRIDVKCFACQEIVDMVRILYRRGKKQEAIEAFLLYMCNLLQLETEVVCKDVIPLFRVGSSDFIHDISHREWNKYAIRSGSSQL